MRYMTISPFFSLDDLLYFIFIFIYFYFLPICIFDHVFVIEINRLSNPQLQQLLIVGKLRDL